MLTLLITSPRRLSLWSRSLRCRLLSPLILLCASSRALRCVWCLRTCGVWLILASLLRLLTLLKLLSLRVLLLNLVVRRRILHVVRSARALIVILFESFYGLLELFYSLSQ